MLPKERSGARIPGGQGAINDADIIRVLFDHIFKCLESHAAIRTEEIGILNDREHGIFGSLDMIVFSHFREDRKLFFLLGGSIPGKEVQQAYMPYVRLRQAKASLQLGRSRHPQVQDQEFQLRCRSIQLVVGGSLFNLTCADNQHQDQSDQ